MPPPALPDPSTPADADDAPPPRLMPPLFWIALAAGLACVLAGAALAWLWRPTTHAARSATGAALAAPASREGWRLAPPPRKV